MSLQPQLASAARELRSNQRLQAGLALIALLVLAWLWLVLSDWRAALAERIVEAEQRVVRMNDLAEQEVWIERAAEARELRDSLAAEVLPAGSPGLAQAAFQTWLQRNLDAIGAQPQMSMESPLRLDSPADVVRVSATLTGSVPTRQVLELIRRIEGERHLMVIPTIQIRSEANQTFRLTVHAFYRLQPQEGSDS